MGISKKEIKKKMLIKKTINEMNKQIFKLEDQKQVYINAGKEAKKKGLTAQYELALSGLKMTMMQQKKVQEMKLNFEITSQMKDMAQMTGEFLKGMGSLSKDMVKLTNEKQFAKVTNEFNEAMVSAETSAGYLQALMDDTSSAFASHTTTSAEDGKEIEALISGGVTAEESTDDMIDKELEELKKKMSI